MSKQNSTDDSGKGADKKAANGNRKMTRNTRRSKSASPFGAVLPIVTAIVAIVMFYYGFKQQSALQANSTVNTDKTPVKPAVNTNEFPTYTEYTAMAKERNWSPVDPLEKFTATIQKYSQIYDLKKDDNDKDFESYVSMLDKEMRFLVEVFKRSPEKSIDLTSALFLSLDVAQQSIYRIMKYRLGSGAARMVTRTAIAQHSSQWVYAPVREVLRATAAGANSSHSHISIDFNSRIGKGNHSLLMKAVQYRLYGLLSVLTPLCPYSMQDAIQVAVTNADGLSVALLIKLDSGTGNLIRGGGGNGDRLDLAAIQHAISSAQTLQYSHIEHRLSSAYGRVLSLDASNDSDGAQVDFTALAGQANAVNEKIEVFNDYAPSNAAVVGDEVSNGISHSTVSGIGSSGYFDTGLQSVIGKAATSTAAAAADGTVTEADITAVSDSRLPLCTVDRARLSDLTVEAFQRDYVALNKPLIIETDGSSTAVDNESSVWRLDNLVAKYGSVDVLASVIPYATLFGRSEVSMTLREFVHHETKGMRAFSEKLQQHFPAEATDISVDAIVAALSTPASTDSVEMVTKKRNWRKNLPLYIFSGQNQKLNQKLTKDMMITIRQFGHYTAVNQATETTEATAETGRLMDILLSVSPPPAADTVDGAKKRNSKSATTTPPKSWRFQFFLGPALSGAPLHNHAPAFNFLIHGRKVWTVLPPGRDVYGSLHPLEWAQSGGVKAEEYPYVGDAVPPTTTPPAIPATATGTGTGTGTAGGDVRPGNAHPCEVRQSAGEVVFIPRHWTHQVLNLAETVGFAVEIEDYVH